jgi:hypothetical protein
MIELTARWQRKRAQRHTLLRLSPVNRRPRGRPGRPLLVVLKLSVPGAVPKLGAPGPFMPPVIVGFWQPRTPPKLVATARGGQMSQSVSAARAVLQGIVKAPLDDMGETVYPRNDVVRSGGNSSSGAPSSISSGFGLRAIVVSSPRLGTAAGER